MKPLLRLTFLVIYILDSLITLSNITKGIKFSDFTKEVAKKLKYLSIERVKTEKNKLRLIIESMSVRKKTVSFKDTGSLDKIFKCKQR